MSDATTQTAPHGRPLTIEARIEQVLREQRDFAERFPSALDAALDAALARRERQVYVNRAQLAQRLGITAKALTMRLARGSKLAAIALRVDGRELWRVGDVDALIAGGAR